MAAVTDVALARPRGRGLVIAGSIPVGLHLLPATSAKWGLSGVRPL